MPTTWNEAAAFVRENRHVSTDEGGMLIASVPFETGNESVMLFRENVFRELIVLRVSFGTAADINMNLAVEMLADRSTIIAIDSAAGLACLRHTLTTEVTTMSELSSWMEALVQFAAPFRAQFRR